MKILFSFFVFALLVTTVYSQNTNTEAPELTIPTLPTGGNSSSFKPSPGDYVISGWVKEEHTSSPSTYVFGRIDIIIGDTEKSFSTLGPIIDGWQLIHGTFTIPDEITELTIKLRSTDTSIVTYFDDIRVFPFNGNMKSFVYDSITQRLLAELL